MHRIWLIPAMRLALIAGFGLFLPGRAFATEDLSAEALRACASAGIPECQFKYGQRLQYGKGLTTDVAEAKRQYEAAYAAGYQPAGEALLNLLRSDRPNAIQVAELQPVRTLSQELGQPPATQTAHDPLECTLGNSSTYECHIPIRAVGGERQGKYLAVLLVIQNPTADTIYVTRGLLSASQSGTPLRVLDEAHSTAGARTASRALQALRLISDFAPTKPGFSGSALRSRAGRSVAGNAVDAVDAPPGRSDYLTNMTIPSGESAKAVVLVELLDRATPIAFEVTVDAYAPTRFTVQVPRP